MRLSEKYSSYFQSNIYFTLLTISLSVEPSPHIKFIKQVPGIKIAWAPLKKHFTPQMETELLPPHNTL